MFAGVDHSFMGNVSAIQDVAEQKPQRRHPERLSSMRSTALTRPLLGGPAMPAHLPERFRQIPSLATLQAGVRKCSGFCAHKPRELTRDPEWFQYVRLP